MIPAEDFVTALADRNFRLFSGVPCSYLTPLINTVITSNEIEYIGAANEGDAVSIVAGAELTGTRGVVLFQNSGLGNAVNPFTSLTETFKIPMLVLCTWRGQPGSVKDEPQHDRMGMITPELLELMEIPYAIFPADPTEVEQLLDHVVEHFESDGTPFALVIPRGAITGNAKPLPFARRPLPEQTPIEGTLDHALDPDETLDVVQACGSSDAIVATTGFTGRALYSRGDHPNQFYMVGSMGCISSLGLGIARMRPDRRVIVLDGDGSLLMRLGAAATIGFETPPNLVHVLLDNEVHDSTGAQATVSPGIDFAGLARACGYPKVARVDDLERLRDVLSDRTPGLSFIHVRTQPRPDRKLPRPTQTPPEVKDRFRAFLAG